MAAVSGICVLSYLFPFLFVLFSLHGFCLSGLVYVVFKAGTTVSRASHSRVCLPYVWCHNVCGMKELQNSEVKSMEPSESAEF